MARGDYVIGAVTPAAHNLSLSGQAMSELKFFVPGYNENLVIKNAQGGFDGLKTPVFHSSADPAEEYQYGSLEKIGDINDALTHTENGPAEKLVCEIKPGRVSRIPAQGGEPAKLKVVLEKWVNEHNYASLSGRAANVFYLLDADDNVISILHAHGFTFMAADKWELIQHIVYQNDAAITDIAEESDIFNVQTLDEILRPKIVVGSVDDKSGGKATHSISDLRQSANPDINGKKALFLESIDGLSEDIELSANDIYFEMKSPSTVLDLKGHTLTLSGNGQRGNLNITDSGSGGKLAVSGDKTNLEITANPDNIVDFSEGSGRCLVNGRLLLHGGTCAAIQGDITGEKISVGSDGVIAAESLKFNAGGEINGENGDINFNKKIVAEDGAEIQGDLKTTEKIILREQSIQFLYQPDRVIMTVGEQSQYADDQRILRYNQSDGKFYDKGGREVVLVDGDWVMIKSMETLSNDLYFKHDRAKIECDRGFRIPLGTDPRAVFIQGDHCLADLLLDKNINSLKNFSDIEKRRVIKNQGRGNRISYNRERIFSGGPPTAHLDFVLPDHPYLLAWDNTEYEGISRSGNAAKCWFAELYYWLDRRFNKTGANRDTHEVVRVPPREASFLRPVGLSDRDRHSRPAWDGRRETIAGGSYSQNGNKITLTGNNADDDIRKIKSGCRVRDDGNKLPSDVTDPQGTVIVRPGSIDIAAKSFEIISAENDAAVSAAVSGDLKLDFSGMAAGSMQLDAFQGHLRDIDTTHGPDNVLVDERYTGPIATGADLSVVINTFKNPRAVTKNYLKDGAYGTPRVSSETRPQNMLAIPYYRL